MNGLLHLSDHRLRSLAIVVLLVLLSTGIFLQFQGVAAAGKASFTGWQVLAVRADKADQDLDHLLEAAGIDHALSLFNVRAAVTTWGPLDHVGLRDFLSRVPASDLRLSPWTVSLPRLFSDRAGGWLLWYLPEAGLEKTGGKERLKPLLATLLASHGDLKEGRDWYLLQESRGGPPWLGLAVGVLFLGIILVFSRTGLVHVLLLGIFCLRGCLGAPVPELAFLGAAFFLWATILELFLPALRRYIQDDQRGTFFWDHLRDPEARAESRKAFAMYADSRALAVRVLLFAAFTLLVPISGIFQGNPAGALGLFLVLVCGPSLMILIQVRFLQKRRERFEHRLFVPVPIMSRSNIFHTRLRKSIPWLWGLGAVVLAFSLLGLGGGKSEGVPSGDFPGFVPGSTGALPARETLFAAWPQGMGLTRPDSAHLPGLEDFLFNQVWQESLPFLRTEARRDFTVPAFGAGIGIKEYNLKGRMVETTTRMVARFDDEWLASLAKPRNSFGPEVLLLDQGCPGQLVYQPLDRIYSSPDWLLASWGITGAFFLLLWLKGKHASNRQWYDVRTSFNQVRKLAV